MHTYIIKQRSTVAFRSFIITPQQLKASSCNKLSCHVGLPWYVPLKNLDEKEEIQVNMKIHHPTKQLEFKNTLIVLRSADMSKSNYLRLRLTEQKGTHWITLSSIYNF